MLESCTIDELKELMSSILKSIGDNDIKIEEINSIKNSIEKLLNKKKETIENSNFELRKDLNLIAKELGRRSK